MLALERSVPINNHRIVLEDDALPVYSGQARVIVMWDALSASPRRAPPLALAGAGEEKGDIISSATTNDWEVLA